MAPGLLVPGPLSLGGCTGQEEACTSSCHGSIAVILATTFAEIGDLCKPADVLNIKITWCPPR